MSIIKRIAKRLSKPEKTKIKTLTFSITNICNLKCIQCSIWKTYDKKEHDLKDEVSIDDIKRFLKGSKYLKSLQEINITGGEPFLKKDFVEIVKYMIDIFPEVAIRISSNGVVGEKILNDLKDIFKYKEKANVGIGFSLDGDMTMHDKLRGKDGIYQKVINTIMLLKRELPNLKISIGFVSTPDNYDQIYDVYKTAKKMGLSFSTAYIQRSENYYGNNIDMKIDWTDAKLKKADELMDRIIEEGNLTFIEKMFYKKGLEYQKYPHRMFECFAGTHSLYVDPYGEVYPCIMLNKSIGNIKNGDFDKEWMSERSESVRNYIKEKKCHCWTNCETIPSLLKDRKILLKNTLYSIRKKNYGK